MTKTQLIDAMAEEAGVSKREAERLLEAFVNTVTNNLKKDEKVAVTGFGTFKVSQRKERKGVNPQNPSEVITIPAVKVPKFTAGKTLKDSIR
ncbi:HU family DNA-binding protein [Patescibacteria group bacterium]|nr:HU family DNA-binding protein [Patescibacteria group bacterium]